MGKFFVSVGVGVAAAIICFFLSVAFLCFVLLIYWGFSHTRPDMSLTYKVAAPVAVLAGLTGFMITLVRSVRKAMAAK